MIEKHIKWLRTQKGTEAVIEFMQEQATQIAKLKQELKDNGDRLDEYYDRLDKAQDDARNFKLANEGLVTENARLAEQHKTMQSMLSTTIDERNAEQKKVYAMSAEISRLSAAAVLNENAIKARDHELVKAHAEIDRRKRSINEIADFAAGKR